MFTEECDFECEYTSNWPEEENVPLGDVCIPLGDCLCVTPGAISKNVIKRLRKNKYDNAPVYDPKSGKYYGLVQTSYLEKLLENRGCLRKDDLHILAENKTVHVRSGLGIFQLIRQLKIESSIVIVQEWDSGEFGAMESPLGLFTISDLNRREIRTIMYRLFLDVESELAKLVQRNMPKPLNWISFLNEEHQVRILGYWELMKMRDVDIGPLAATTISNLLTIVRKVERVYKLLGFKTRKEFDKYSGQLPDFRNRVMHPVRPVVLDRHDLNELYEVIGFLRKLKNRLVLCSEKNRSNKFRFCI